MKLFALKDSLDHESSTLAILSCYGRMREYYIDMPEDTDPWTVPFILSSFAERGRWTIGADWSRKWVESRLVPRNRQNLGEVLKENGLDAYDTLRLLELTEGRNSQDSCYLEHMSPAAIPEWFARRERKRVIEVVALDEKRLLIAFRDKKVLICKAHDLTAHAFGLENLLGSPEAFCRCTVAPGGRGGVRWGTTVEVNDADLRAVGQPTGLSWDDIVRVVSAVLLDTNEAAQVLDCSRQNLSALVKRGSLTPVKTGAKSTLFLRADMRSRAAGSPPSASATTYASITM